MAVRVGISFTHKRSLMTVLQVYFCQTVAIRGVIRLSVN